MAEFKLSRIRYTWKGQWQAGASYIVDDVVSYGGKAYVSLTQHSSSPDFYDDLNFYNTDSPPALTPKWELMIDGYNQSGDWQTSTFYSEGDIVRYYGINYICGTSHTSASTIPGFASDISNWILYTQSSHWLGDWETNTYYKPRDIVKLNGIVYICNTAHTSTPNPLVGITPDLSKWNVYIDSEYWKSDWTPNGHRYELNDVVKHGGVVYRCIAAHLSQSRFELDQSSWTVVHSGIEYRGTWSGSSVDYKLNDIVKYGGNLWKCNESHTSSATFDPTWWSTFLPGTDYLPGYEYEATWDSAALYQPGDVVRYGGYLYVSKTNNDNKVPSTETDDWSVLLVGARIQSVWNEFDDYIVGDVVRHGGQLYEANADSTNQSPAIGTSVNSSYWTLLVPGEDWKDIWSADTNYAIGDLVHWIYKTYRCKNVHTSETANRPDNDTLGTYWVEYIVGDSANVLSNIGDLKTYSSSPVILPIGEAGKLLKANNGIPEWGQLNVSEKVYYVAPTGQDLPGHGTTIASPWKSIRYACENITGPASIFVKTGLYKEILPIIVPAGVSIIGDEIRGAIVEPAVNVVPESDVAYTLEAFNYINSILSNIVLAALIPPLDPTVAQDISNPPGNLEAANELVVNVNAMYDIISTKAFPEIEGTNTLTINSNKLAAALQVESNIDFIVAQTIEHIKRFDLEYTFDNVACARDLTKFLEAIIYDLRYTGNYKSVQAAGYYLNAVDGELNVLSDMFYLRDSTGLRNMTFKGLLGELTPAGVGFLEERRPTGGTYVSLDPGWGPADSRTWITTRSPYIQNCTTFGVGCVGMKLDGDLHADGLKSMVANDFTQILDDGIGIWVNKDAKTEIVSVFTYYNYIGYLATDGGKIRATNGNNSYGIYGSISDGVNPTEVPITATVNNRYYDATVGSVLCDTNGGILKLFYSNGGQDYTTASYTVEGGGFGASLLGDEIRQGGVSEVRVVDPGDSSIPGGGSYLFTTNSSQGGDDTSVILAGSDENLEENYLGMRVFITKGKGVGQYGYITAYDDISKTASISKESTGTPGWDHIIPGTTIETALDSTSTYTVEPRIEFTSPGSSTTAAALPVLRHWQSVAAGNNMFVAVSYELDNAPGDTAAYSNNGTTWTLTTLPAVAKWRDVVYGNGVWVAVAEGSVSASSTNGSVWTARSIPTGEWTSVAFGKNKFVAVASGGTQAAYSTDGVIWTAATLPEGADWSSVTYGKGKFVAVSYSDSTTTSTAYSADGITWTSGSFVGGCSCVAYGSNKFVAFDGAVSGDTVFYSLDGITWSSVTLSTPRNWKSVAYGGGRFIAVADGAINALTSVDGINWEELPMSVSASWTGIAYGSLVGTSAKFIAVSGNPAGETEVSLIEYGTTAQARVDISSGRITQFNIWEPGSGYTSAPVISITDPNNTSDAVVTVSINNGVLASPSIVTPGSNYQGYNTTATIVGDGFMDSHQLGKELIVSNLTRLPRPGANLSISGINDYTYKITSAALISGSPGNYLARLTIIKGLDSSESPEHNTAVEIREQYSQCRITGHDLLNIGLGNIYQTNFPDILHPNGTIASPENETVERNGGRVFYTSTNDLGNFRVGELFAVEQATGTVTLNAEFFELQGLEELKLGGVSVGTTAVVIREFSTDSTFTADSNNIVPTQRAIKAYLTRRVSGGGSDAITGGVVSGLVTIGSPDEIGTTFGTLNIDRKVTFKGGVSGTMLAMSYFTRRN